MRSQANTSEHPAKERHRLGPAAALVATLLVLAGVYGAFLVVLRPTSPGTEVTLDALIDDAAAKRVRSVRFLDQDARIAAKVVPRSGGAPRSVWTAYPRSDAATNDLLKTFVAADTAVRVDTQSTKEVVRFLAQFLLPLVILANLFALVFVLVRGAGSSGAGEFLVFGRVGDKRVGKERARTTFADVAAAEAEVTELAEVRDYLADPSAFKAMGALPPKGVLLVGPPGCGKTLLARAVAGEADAAFYAISGSEFVESLVGVGAARVRDLFRQARANAPAIVFIDELDGAGRQRGTGLGGGHDEREQTLNELLVQMDGFSPTEGVVVIGATNRADILDPALLRAGRFDRHITVERPDMAAREAILRLHASGRRLADPDAHLPVIARRTPGFTGADLASVINEAALLAVREKAGNIGASHLEEAVERVLAGPRRRGQLLAADDKQRIAVHEAGHAVVAAAFGKAEAVEKLSVISRGRGVGHVAVVAEHKPVLTRQDMETQVAVAMAGIAAEEMVLGQPSTGSEADLERATNTARDMAGRFGMSGLGRRRLLREEREVFLGRDYLMTKDVSPPTLERLDAEVERILGEQEAEAKSLLVYHREVLDSLVEALVSLETIQGAELAKILARVLPHTHDTARRAARRDASAS